VTEPAVLFISPMRPWRRLDLPLPTGPTMATRLPRGTLRLRFLMRNVSADRWTRSASSDCLGVPLREAAFFDLSFDDDGSAAVTHSKPAPVTSTAAACAGSIDRLVSIVWRISCKRREGRVSRIVEDHQPREKGWPYLKEREGCKDLGRVELVADADVANKGDDGRQDRKREGDRGVGRADDEQRADAAELIPMSDGARSASDLTADPGTERTA
jgi:hypothetical protein